MAKQKTGVELTTVSFDQPLPLASLNPESFERFCLDFLASHYQGRAKVHPAGKTGHKQYGIDIEALFADDAVFTFQCKRERQFGPEKVKTAITAQTIEAKEKIILLSRVASPEARNEIRPVEGWDIWDQTDISRIFRTLPKSEQIRIVAIYFPTQRFALTGEIEPGPWLTAADFFAPHLVEGRSFNHCWGLIGRTAELEQLAVNLANQEVIAVNLIGRAGEGKSRVLRSALENFLETHPHVRVVVASPTEEITAKALENLGAGEKLLVIDDVHDRDDLEQVIRYAADQRQQARLLLVYRSYWRDIVQRELAEAGLIGQYSAPVELAKPTKQDAVALASQVLEKLGASTSHATRIADITFDSPLAVVIGAQIVAKEGLHPELFGSNEVFQATVLKHYEQFIAEGLAQGKDQDRVHGILRVLSLIQPVAPDSGVVIELLKEMEEITAPDATRLARLLIESGVLFKRGAAYRLSPDLLADSIIASGCITPSGVSNGYAEALFEKCSPEHKEHLLLNLGRLDWRRNEGDTSSSRLLDGIWAKLEWKDDYQDANVKAAAAAAYFQPRQALTFAHKLVLQGHGADENVSRMIQNAAYNQKYLTQACELLWEIGKNDTRATNSHPHHALRILTELATPMPRKPVEYCEEVVAFALSLLPIAESWTNAATPFDILKGALSTEGHTSTATSRKVTFAPYGVNHEAVAAMRRRIIDTLIESLSCINKQQAFTAAEMLQTALHGPIGMFNRKPTDAEVSEWSQEFADTLVRTNAKLEAVHLPAVILVRLAQSVSWHAFYSTEPSCETAKDIIARLDRDFETRVTRVLMDGWRHDTWQLDPEKRELNRQHQEQLTTEAEARFPSAGELAVFLEARLRDIQSYRQSLLKSAFIFVSHLIERRIDLAREILDAKQRDSGSVLADFSALALNFLLRLEPAEAHEHIKVLSEEGTYRLHTIAQAYSMGVFWNRKLQDADREVIQQIFRSEDTLVLGFASDIFREVARLDKPLAIDLLTRANTALMVSFGGSVCLWLDDENTIPFGQINDADLERITQLFLAPESLDEHSARRFLAKVAKRNPRLVFKLAKSRLELAVAKDSWTYEPLGFSEDESLNLLEHPDGATLLLESLDWAKPKIADWRFAHHFAQFVAGTFGFTEPILATTLQNWSAGGNSDHFAVLAAVLREVPASFVFSEQTFVRHSLSSARSLGKSVHDDVQSSLYAAAIGGMRSGTPGEPFPADIQRKEQAEEILTMLSKTDPAYPLYDNIREEAERCINRQIAEGKAMDEEDADE